MDAKTSDEASGNALQVPEPAHLRRESSETTIQDDTDTDSELEATELRQWNRNVHSTLPPISHVISPGKPIVHWYDPIKKFWRHQIRISVPHDDCRDHLANERTFLGFLRTSVALSMMGIVVAQFWRLEHSIDPSEVFGYYILSKPLAGILQGAALCVILIGGFRFWRQQSAMAIGKVHAGGWELTALGVGAFLVGQRLAAINQVIVLTSFCSCYLCYLPYT